MKNKNKNRPVIPYKKDKSIFIYGMHPVSLALKNPNRTILELLLVQGVQPNAGITPNIPVRYVQKEYLDELLGPESVHQGIVARCAPLVVKSIDAILEAAEEQESAVIILLDQVTDPHNIGAILRSSVAFDALCVIMPEAGAPDETGVLAKSASGALDLIPLIKVPNLIRTIEKIKKAGFWCLGMDGNAPHSLPQEKLPKKCAFIMGSEGSGMRHLTRENCDYMTKLPMNPVIDSLNVSVATALALYEWSRQHHAHT